MPLARMPLLKFLPSMLGTSQCVQDFPPMASSITMLPLAPTTLPIWSHPWTYYTRHSSTSSDRWRRTAQVCCLLGQCKFPPGCSDSWLVHCPPTLFSCWSPYILHSSILLNNFFLHGDGKCMTGIHTHTSLSYGRCMWRYRNRREDSIVGYSFVFTVTVSVNYSVVCLFGTMYLCVLYTNILKSFTMHLCRPILSVVRVRPSKAYSKSLWWLEKKKWS